MSWRLRYHPETAWARMEWNSRALNHTTILNYFRLKIPGAKQFKFSFVWRVLLEARFETEAHGQVTPSYPVPLTFGCCVMLLSSTVDTTNSHDSESTDTLFCRAHVCSTAVKKPVGKVKPDIQNITGWWAVVAHLANCSTRSTRSRVQLPSGLLDG